MFGILLVGIPAENRRRRSLLSMGLALAMIVGVASCSGGNGGGGGGISGTDAGQLYVHRDWNHAWPQRRPPQCHGQCFRNRHNSVVHIHRESFFKPLSLTVEESADTFS